MSNYVSSKSHECTVQIQYRRGALKSLDPVIELADLVNDEILNARDTLTREEGLQVLPLLAV
jgi:hypothetical protein